MVSVGIWTTLVTVTVLLMTRCTVAYDHGDHVCMECPCGPHGCSGNSASCCYKFDPKPLDRLSVDVNCSHPGHSHIIDPKIPSTQLFQDSSYCTGYSIVHERSCLTDFPDNYCQYPTTRDISLYDNALSTFPNLTCLSILGRLDLRFNKLKAVPKHAFRGLKYIRDIFLDYNEIAYIDPLAFDDDLTEVSRFSVSHNHLVALEAGWVFTLHYSFCYFDFSHNRLHDFTNEGHWKFNNSISVNYGPGFVDMSYNNIEDGPVREMKKYGIDSILKLAKFMRWGFDFRHNPIRCDCQIYDPVRWAKGLAKVMWRNYYNVTCGSPSNLRGLPILNIPLDEFVCNITVHCPPGCYCQDQPAHKAMHVNCDGAGLASLPDHLPQRENRVLMQLANNAIHSLEPRLYLARTKIIDLRGNKLNHISEESPRLLVDAELIDLRHNEIQYLPSSFQIFDPEVLYLDLHTLKCSCDLDWFPGWLRHSRRHTLDGITCTKDNGEKILLIEARRHDLCDEKPHPHHAHFKISLIVIISLLAVVISLLVVFRYEAQVMIQIHGARRSHRSKIGNFPALLTKHRFDVFICVTADSMDMNWANNVLIPASDRHGLTSYMPSRDCEPGSVEMDETIKRMKDSAVVVVVVSADYVQNASCLFQFSQAYNHMIARKQGRLLIIKREGLLPRAVVREPRLRAMLTLRMFYGDDPEKLDKALDTLVFEQVGDL